MEWNSVPAVASARNAVRARWRDGRAQPGWLRALRLVAPAVWIVATICFVAFEGLPLTRDWIAAWILLGLLAFSLGDLGGWFRGVVFDWLPFFGILALYDLLRGVADGLIFRPFFLPQIDVDKFLFFGTVPTVWLQEHLYTPGTLPWYGVIAWMVYMSHFFATPLLAGILWKVDRMRFRRYAACVAVLSLLGFATYALFPAAPPWMAGEAGLIPQTARVIPEIWGQLGFAPRFGVVGTGYEYANDVAAVPSLHAAFSLLISLELWPRGFAAAGWPTRRRWAIRLLLVAYPLAMAFGLVYSGEHYVSDILLGWLYAAITVWGVRKAFARWAARHPRDPVVTSGSFSTTTD